MKVFGRFKVISISEEQFKKVQQKQVPMCYVVLNEGDSYLTVTVWGKEKINLCYEKMNAEVEMECVLSITGKAILKDDGSTYYSNNINIKHIL